MSRISKDNDQKSSLLVFHDFYSSNKGEEITFICHPDERDSTQKLPDALFQKANGSLIAVETTRLFFSTEHMNNKARWIKFLQEARKLLNNNITATYSISIKVDKNELFQPPKNAKDFVSLILAEKDKIKPLEERAYKAPFVFILKRYIHKNPKISFLFSFGTSPIDSQTIKSSIWPPIKEANEKLGNIKSEEKVVILDDRTELNILDAFNETQKQTILDAISLIPNNDKSNITGYYIVEGPEIFEIDKI